MAHLPQKISLINLETGTVAVTLEYSHTDGVTHFYTDGRNLEPFTTAQILSRDSGDPLFRMELV